MRRTGAILLLIVLILGLSWSLSSSGAGTDASQQVAGRSINGGQAAVQDDTGVEIIVSEPVVPTISGPVTNLPPAEMVYRLDREINPRLTNLDVDPTLSGVGSLDPLLAVQADAPQRVSDFLTPTLNFDGQGYTGVNPPDTVGEIGADHYVQMINSGGGANVTIYDKAGNLVSGPFTLGDLGTGSCASGSGDPIVLYDELAERWLLSEFASGGNHLCVYVSDSNNPVTASWYAYDFTTPSFPDYPKYAVWHDAYYVTSNESSPAAYALDRDAMLQGNAATSQRFTATDLSGFSFQALTPSDHDGPQAPPAGAPNYVMRHRDTEVHGAGTCTNAATSDCLEIWEFDVDFATPANSSFTLAETVEISEFDSDLCGLTSFFCFPMPGTSTTLDPLREVVMWRLQYRNFGSYEVLVGNLVTDVDGTDHGGIRWFELRKVGAGNWTLHQEGTLAPDADHRWMASSAMDVSGNMAMGYSVSSDTVFPSIRYAGRAAGDPLGTLTFVEGTIIDGTSSNSSNRWGDYSSINVDPVDGCTFWYTHMYNTSSNWSTRISSFRFPNCGSTDFTISADPVQQDVCMPDDAVFDVELSFLDGYSNPVDLSADNLPPSTTATFVPSQVVSPTTSSILTIGNTGASSAGSYDIDIIGMGQPTPTHTTTVQLELFDSAPGSITLVSPADAATDVELLPTFTWDADAQGDLYWLEVAEDSGFSSLVFTATVPATSTMVDSPLDSSTTYYWRVTGSNLCGVGVASATYSFTTLSAPGDCGPGTAPISIYEEDFEAGDGGWTHGSNVGTDTWGLSSSNPNSGSQHFHANDVSSVSDQYLVSPEISLPSGQGPLTFQFWNYQEMEDSGGGCFDGGILEISTDGGVNWAYLNSELLTDPYDGPIAVGFDNPLIGFDAWCGDPQPFLNSIVDVDAFEGEDVNFRFRLGTDNSVSHPGWDVDDVKVQACAPSGSVGTLTGTVTDANTGDPLDGALVEVGPQSATTDGNGDYSLTLTTGMYVVNASATGYEAATITDVEVISDTTTTLDIALDAPSLAVDLSEYEVTVSLGTTTTLPLDLINSGATVTDFELMEAAGGSNSSVTISIPESTSVNGLGGLKQPVSTRATPTSFEVSAGLSSLANSNILILSPDADVSDLLAALTAFPDINAMVYGGDLSTLTVGDLLPYDVVMTSNNAQWAAAGADVSVGDALADFIDAGGKVIVNSFVYDWAGWELSGRFINEQYGPFSGTSSDFVGSSSLGTVYDPSHPIMDGVNAITNGYLWQNPSLAPGATRLADWNDGNMFVAFNDNVVALNVLPSDGSGNPGWTGDLPTLYHNAIVWLTSAATDDIPWLSEDPITGTVDADSMLTVDLTFDASVVSETGTYSGTLTVNSDDPLNPMIDIPVVMHVIADAAEYGVTLATTEDEMQAEGGETIVYDVAVTNTGNVDDAYTLTLSGNAWTTSLSDSSLILGPGETTTVTVTVEVPAGSMGESDTVTVTATSDNDAAATDALDLTTSTQSLTIWLPLTFTAPSDG